MTFDIRRLDNLDYGDAEPLLEEYIVSAIQAFVESTVGQDYIKDHPEGGNWIGTFMETAYLYEGLTLPKMTKSSVQMIMQYTLPRKLTLLDPSDTDDAIPELVAFWSFLKQEYKLRSAGAIAKYLLSIQDKFRDWMFDSSRGGISKQFVMKGMEAGYDMTTPEGAAAFQAEYNERIKTEPQAAIRPMPMYPMTAPPPDVQQMLDQLGVELPEVGSPVNPATLMNQILSAIEQKEAALEKAAAAPPPLTDMQAIRAELAGGAIEEELSLSTAESAILEAQTITETGPGSILQDFQTILDFIGSDGIPASGKRYHIPLKLLIELNQRLSKPVDIALKRPLQKSYPPIQGLYLLLRATGMVEIAAQGKQYRLKLNPKIFDSWQELNPTERYCTLLEAWLVRGYEEMLGEDHSGPFSEGELCFKGWSRLTEKKKTSYAKYADQDQLNYFPKFSNLALMEMFGLLKITPGKPEAGKGWRFRQVEVLPFGKALMTLVKNTYLNNQLQWSSQTDPTIPFNELQPALQPYFPEWRESLAVPVQAFRSGRYIFKVFLGKIWRRIAISGEATLDVLSGLILESVNFDFDHLDQFTYTNELGRKMEVVHPDADGDYFTDEVKIGSLPLSEGSVMQYVFDFGDWWEFEVQLEAIEPESEAEQGAQKTKPRKRRKPPSRKPLGEILEVHGEAPPQYPGEEEDW
ncbi:MAG: hypothetical protein QNJ46_32310 [Leptolyngbyaceae cyanobacterium MO_188.B28]|nr:hypothetical protein [Leptolyngbyaceae cyanobacterium MO_188.B28]